MDEHEVRGREALVGQPRGRDQEAAVATRAQVAGLALVDARGVHPPRGLDDLLAQGIHGLRLSYGMVTAVLSPAIGRDALDYRDAQHPELPLVVHTYRPADHGPDDPVVLVQHGVKRNGDEYRDYWIDAAEKHRLLIVTTTFGDAAFPKPENYNNGRVVAPDGTIRPRADWLYAILPRVVAALRAGGVTRHRRVRLYGHSAGGQFVHRLAATQDHALYEAIASANSGWYTLPKLERPFPEGLGGLGLARFGSCALARLSAHCLRRRSRRGSLRPAPSRQPRSHGARPHPLRARPLLRREWAGRGKAPRCGMQLEPGDRAGRGARRERDGKGRGRALVR